MAPHAQDSTWKGSTAYNKRILMRPDYLLHTLTHDKWVATRLVRAS